MVWSMHRFWVLIFAFSFGAVSAFAVEGMSINPRFGFGWGSCLGENAEEAFGSCTGWNASAGIFLTRNLFGSHSLRTGLNLNYKDFRSNIRASSGGESFDGDRIVSWLGLGIPVLWQENLGTRFFVNGGFLPGIKIFAKRKDVVTSEWENLSEARRLFMEVVAGAGAVLPWRLSLDLTGAYTLSDILHSERIHGRVLRFQIGASKGWEL